MPPTKLAHLVFQTNRLKDMRDWYCSVLGGAWSTKTHASPS